MDSLPNSSTDTDQKPPRTSRKRRSKNPPTVAELVEHLQDTKTQLRAARASEREEHISRMGYLAHKAGLQRYDSATLSEAFAALAKRLAGAVGVVLYLLQPLGFGLLLVTLLGGCIDRRTTVQLHPVAPAYSLPSISPDGSVQCWPQRSPFDNCRWVL